ncbi:hypothetical protein [Eubacterium ventriosum]|uniref:hypothetical protein n=1 Tax=Eubacterium ventriosum TaxID=39496 RepID=UPI00265FB528|nr:hypothetical protein [Eubacterium ventriosum]
MLNIEYYKDKLKELGIINLDKLALCKGQPHICDDNIRCCECLFNHSFSCSDAALNWLFSEYEEPEVDWSKVKVDTPILVRDTEGHEWTKRYFAKFVDGKVYTWCDGATSWTACGESPWNCAKLAESEN